MNLSSGTLLGPYRIDALVGEGGMGEVYRAVDTRLDRLVAVKILPSHLSSNPALKERFDREARAISSLSHPHICTLFDVGHQAGVDYLVMEYLEGESLAFRLNRGPLPIEQVLRIGSQVADALAKAHRQGVIHRDLKPGNIMLTKSGAKLLDFGLAKAAATSSRSDPEAPTLAQERTHPLTREGTVVGTFQYMAPEQLEGQEADARSDLFALGCVLYEMTTGRRAFDGPTQSTISAAILTSSPPPVSDLQPLTPHGLAHVIAKCLSKDPEDRWQSAADLGAQLRWIAERDPLSSSAGVPARKGRRHLLPWVLVAVAAMTAVALAIQLKWRSDARPVGQALHLTVPPPPNTTFSTDVVSHDFAISPDGTRLVFVAGERGSRPQLWVRPLASAEAKPLAGTEGATSLFWSPDSSHIAFFAEGELRRIAASGGPVQSICAASVGSGSWGKNGIIVFAESEGREGILRVPAAGGPVTLAVSPPPRRPIWTYWPEFLPDGQRFVYLETNPHAPSVLRFASLDGRSKGVVEGVRSRAVYAPPGFLIFVREGALLAQPFDADTARLSGEPSVVAPSVPYFETVGWANFSVSSNRVLIHQGGQFLAQLTWFDRGGRAIGTVGDPAAYGSIRLSPDGRRVAVSRSDPKSGADDLWIHDLQRNVATRFTSDPGNEFNAVWSRDGTHIVYAFDQQGSATLHEKAVTDPGAGEELLPLERFKLPLDLSPDGRFILYSDTSATTGFDLWLLPADGERKPKPLLQSRFDENGGAFSPDGKWLAFVSSESGRPEVYIQSLEGGEKHRISTAGGSGPRWRRDGREFFYMRSDDTVIAIPVLAGPHFATGTPVELFTIDPMRFKNVFDSYDVAADGQRFLVNTRIGGPQIAPIHVLVNFLKESS